MMWKYDRALSSQYSSCINRALQKLKNKKVDNLHMFESFFALKCLAAIHPSLAFITRLCWTLISDWSITTLYGLLFQSAAMDNRLLLWTHFIYFLSPNTARGLFFLVEAFYVGKQYSGFIYWPLHKWLCNKRDNVRRAVHDHEMNPRVWPNLMGTHMGDMSSHIHSITGKSTFPLT